MAVLQQHLQEYQPHISLPSSNFTFSRRSFSQTAHRDSLVPSTDTSMAFEGRSGSSPSRQLSAPSINIKVLDARLVRQRDISKDFKPAAHHVPTTFSPRESPAGNSGVSNGNNPVQKSPVGKKFSIFRGGNIMSLSPRSSGRKNFQDPVKNPAEKPSSDDCEMRDRLWEELEDRNLDEHYSGKKDLSKSPVRNLPEGCEKRGLFHVLEFGRLGTLKHRILFFESTTARSVSPLHEIPLFGPDGTFNFVCKTPRGSWIHYEVAHEEECMPLRVIKLRGSPGHYAQNVPCNYGFFPQTFADSETENGEFGGFVSDNLPIEVLDISEQKGVKEGEVYPVKALSAFAVIDSGVTLSWKVVAIARSDPMAPVLQSMEDVEQHLPGLLDNIRYWLEYRHCIGADDRECTFGLNKQPADLATVMQVIAQSHASWQLLEHASTPPGPASPSPLCHLTSARDFEREWRRYTSKDLDDRIEASESSTASSLKYDKAWASTGRSSAPSAASSPSSSPENGPLSSHNHSPTWSPSRGEKRSEFGSLRKKDALVFLKHSSSFSSSSSTSATPTLGREAAGEGKARQLGRGSKFFSFRGFDKLVGGGQGGGGSATHKLLSTGSLNEEDLRQVKVWKEASRKQQRNSMEMERSVRGFPLPHVFLPPKEKDERETSIPEEIEEGEEEEEEEEEEQNGSSPWGSLRKKPQGKSGLGGFFRRRMSRRNSFGHEESGWQQRKKTFLPSTSSASDTEDFNPKKYTRQASLPTRLLNLPPPARQTTFPPQLRLRLEVLELPDNGDGSSSPSPSASPSSSQISTVHLPGPLRTRPKTSPLPLNSPADSTTSNSPATPTNAAVTGVSGTTLNRVLPAQRLPGGGGSLRRGSGARVVTLVGSPGLFPGAASRLVREASISPNMARPLVGEGEEGKTGKCGMAGLGSGRGESLDRPLSPLSPFSAVPSPSAPVTAFPRVAPVLPVAPPAAAPLPSPSASASSLSPSGLVRGPSFEMPKMGSSWVIQSGPPVTHVSAPPRLASVNRNNSSESEIASESGSETEEDVEERKHHKRWGSLEVELDPMEPLEQSSSSKSSESGRGDGSETEEAEEGGEDADKCAEQFWVARSQRYRDKDTLNLEEAAGEEAEEEEVVSGVEKESTSSDDEDEDIPIAEVVQKPSRRQMSPEPKEEEEEDPLLAAWGKLELLPPSPEQNLENRSIRSLSRRVSFNPEAEVITYNPNLQEETAKGLGSDCDSDGESGSSRGLEGEHGFMVENNLLQEVEAFDKASHSRGGRRMSF